jgi:membrane-associated phospholipid phosphatase
MPSSHTALAVVMSVFLITLYPRLRPFGVAMVVVVGGCRVLFRDHYPTDVLIGALVGYLLAHLVIVRSWGQQIVDWVQFNAGQGAARSEPSSLVTAPERERYAK